MESVVNLRLLRRIVYVFMTSPWSNFRVSLYKKYTSCYQKYTMMLFGFSKHANCYSYWGNSVRWLTRGLTALPKQRNAVGLTGLI